MVADVVEYPYKFVQSVQKIPAGLATFAMGTAGAINAALFAASMLHPADSDIAARLQQTRDEQVERVHHMQHTIPQEWQQLILA